MRSQNERCLQVRMRGLPQTKLETKLEQPNTEIRLEGDSSDQACAFYYFFIHLHPLPSIISSITGNMLYPQSTHLLCLPVQEGLQAFKDWKFLQFQF